MWFFLFIFVKTYTMKKILFLLLLSVACYGQTSTGQETEFDYGIKNNAAQEITTPTYLTTTGVDGTQGKIPSAYIEKTANKDNGTLTTSSTTYPTSGAVKSAVDLKVDKYIKSNESLALAQRKDDVLYGILDQYTGEEITLSKVTGTPTVDGIIYFQLGAEYFKRNYEQIKVEWFNPVGDGITDDYTVLQKVIDAALPGEVILFGEGTQYAILTNLLINKSLKIEGNNASLVLTSGIYGIRLEKLITSDHVGNYFNTVVGENSFSIPVGITIKEGDFLFLYSNTERISGTKFGDYVLVKKVQSGIAYTVSPFLHDYQVDHILVYDGVDNSSIKNLTVDARNVPVLDFNTHVFGISFYGTNINIEKCTVLGNDYCGAGILANGINCTIKGNYVSGFLNTQGTGGTGRIGYGISVGGHNIVVDHNTTIDNKHNIMAGSGLVMSRKITYSNNYATQDMDRFGELSEQGGVLFGHSIDCHANVLDLIIENNWIEGQNIVMGVRNGTFKIKDNRIVMLGRVGVGDAIQVYESTFTNCEISNNTLIDSSGETVQGNAVHISCDASDKNIRNLKIIGNNFDNYNILLTGTGTAAPSNLSNVVISENTGSSLTCSFTGNINSSYFDRNSISSDTEGLLVSTSGDISNISVSDNNIEYHKNIDSGAFSYGIRIESSSSLIPSMIAGNIVSKVNILADKASITSLGPTNLILADNTVNYNWSLNAYGSAPIGNINTAGTLTWKGSTSVSKNGDFVKSTAPATGAWVVGDKVFNSSPVDGINIGWVCVVSGTPGTWVTFGKIDNDLLTLKSGTTAQRPSVTVTGYEYFDTTLNKTIWWDGASWVINGIYGSGTNNFFPRFSGTYGIVNSSLTYDGVTTNVSDGNLQISGNSNGTRSSLTLKNLTTNFAILGSEQHMYGVNTSDLGLYVYGSNKISLSTNNVRRLIIDGSGILTFSTAPTTSVGTYDFLTRNTSTGVVEKISTLTSTMVGLGNVDNTSDASKPVSTATQTALDLKANLSLFASGTYTPTLTNTTNISSSTLNAAYYTKIGNIITVTIAVQVTLTAAADTVLTFSLPVSGANVVNGIGQGNLTSGGGAVNAYGIIDTTDSTTAQLRIGSTAVAGSGAGVAAITFTYSL